MFKVYDYMCSNETCKMNNQAVELFVADELVDEQKCEQCKGKLNRVIAAVKGFVKGTSNRCNVFSKK